MASLPAAIHDPPAPLRRSIWPRYRDNLARHLIGISRDLQSRVMQRLGQDLGYAALRPSFGPFLSLIWDGGRPLTAIAGELAISNQACSQLANHAETAGYLERRPNPRDRRSKLVVLTARGRALVETGIARHVQGDRRDWIHLTLEIKIQQLGLAGKKINRLGLGDQLAISLDLGSNLIGIRLARCQVPRNILAKLARRSGLATIDVNRSLFWQFYFQPCIR